MLLGAFYIYRLKCSVSPWIAQTSEICEHDIHSGSSHPANIVLYLLSTFYFSFVSWEKVCHICSKVIFDCNMFFTKSKIQSNLSFLSEPEKEQDVDLGFSCFPRIYLILFSASSIGKVSGGRLLHSGPDKLLKLKCAAAQSSFGNNQLLWICILPIQIIHLLWDE